MKKLYTLILSAAVCGISNAQLTQANHAPSSGDTYTMMEVSNTNITPGASGANVVWNFGTASVTSVAHNYTVQPSTDANYPTGALAVGFSSANVNYVTSSSSALLYHGGNIEVQAIKATLDYSAPAVWASYPMGLNTTSSSVIGGVVNVTSPQNATGTFTGNSSVVADGTGTLILTTGTFTDVMRVKATQTIDFSLAGGFIQGQLIQEIFEYYGGGKKAPLFSIMSGTMNVGGPPSSESIVTQNKEAVITTGTVTGVEEAGKASGVRIYPQPATELVTIEHGGSQVTAIEVFDVTGKKVDAMKVNGQKTQVNVGHYQQGVYFFSLLDRSNVAVSTGKFTVSH